MQKKCLGSVYARKELMLPLISEITHFLCRRRQPAHTFVVYTQYTQAHVTVDHI